MQKSTRTILVRTCGIPPARGEKAAGARLVAALHLDKSGCWVYIQPM
jgi:hypothetical protein